MENATKALLIAAGVMIGMMILSLGVYLYTNLSSYTEEVKEQMEINSNNKFNTQFLKYVNATKCSASEPNKINISGTYYKTEFELTLQDVITAANLAYENNKSHDLEKSVTDYANENSLNSEDLKNSLYVKVTAPVIKDASGTTEAKNEKDLSISASQWLSYDKNGQKYICLPEDVKISEKTGRVYEINFRLKP